MSTYFITGGLGFLGQYIVQRIHQYDAQGELRVLTRTRHKTLLDLHKLDRIKWVEGELTQPDTFLSHLQGVDVVIHNAAMVLFAKSDAGKVFAANVVGTRNLADAANRAGCRRFIFVSSISALDFRPSFKADETFVPDLAAKQKNDMYGYTKRLSEIELFESQNNFHTVALNPSVILGPGSARVEAVMGLIKKMPVLPVIDYVNAFVDVRDVADAVALSVDHGRDRERYIVSSHNESMLRFTETVVRLMGKKTPVLPISRLGLSALDGLVALLDLASVNPGIRRPAQMNIDKPCSNQKITAEMGWAPKFSLEQSITDAIYGTG